MGVYSFEKLNIVQWEGDFSHFKKGENTFYVSLYFLVSLFLFFALLSSKLNATHKKKGEEK